MSDKLPKSDDGGQDSTSNESTNNNNGRLTHPWVNGVNLVTYVSATAIPSWMGTLSSEISTITDLPKGDIGYEYTEEM